MKEPLFVPAGPDCPSELALDRFVSRADDPATHAGLAAHLSQCLSCARRRRERETEVAAFAAAVDAGALPVPAAPARETPRRPAAWRLPAAAVAVLAAAAALVLVVRGGPEEVRSKGRGRSSLRFFVKRGAETWPGKSGEVVHPGDALRFAYSASRPGHLAILSVDGERHVSVYSPDDAVSWPAPAGTDVLVPGSVILDGSSGEESVYAVFCERPVDVAALRASWRASGPVFPDGCEVSSLLLDKRRP